MLLKTGKLGVGYASTMSDAEAFFNKPSPFQKAAQEKAKAALEEAKISSETTESVAKVLEYYFKRH